MGIFKKLFKDKQSTDVYYPPNVLPYQQQQHHPNLLLSTPQNAQQQQPLSVVTSNEQPAAAAGNFVPLTPRTLKKHEKYMKKLHEKQAKEQQKLMKKNSKAAKKQKQKKGKENVKTAAAGGDSKLMSNNGYVEEYTSFADFMKQQRQSMGITPSHANNGVDRVASTGSRSKQPPAIPPIPLDLRSRSMPHIRHGNAAGLPFVYQQPPQPLHSATSAASGGMTTFNAFASPGYRQEKQQQHVNEEKYPLDEAAQQQQQPPAPQRSNRTHSFFSPGQTQPQQQQPGATPNYHQQQQQPQSATEQEPAVVERPASAASTASAKVERKPSIFERIFKRTPSQASIARQKQKKQAKLQKQRSLPIQQQPSGDEHVAKLASQAADELYRMNSAPLSAEAQQQSHEQEAEQDTTADMTHSSAASPDTLNVESQSALIQGQPGSQQLPTELLPILQHPRGYRFLLTYLYAVYGDHYLLCAKLCEKFMMNPSRHVFHHIWLYYIRHDASMYVDCVTQKTQQIVNAIITQNRAGNHQSNAAHSQQQLEQMSGAVQDIIDDVLGYFDERYMPEYQRSELYYHYLNPTIPTPVALQLARSPVHNDQAAAILREQRVQHATNYYQTSQRPTDFESLLHSRAGYLFVLLYLYGHGREDILVAYKAAQLYKMYPSSDALRTFYRTFIAREPEGKPALFTIMPLSPERKQTLTGIILHPSFKNIKADELYHALDFIIQELFHHLLNVEYPQFMKSGAYQHYTAGKQARRVLKRYTSEAQRQSNSKRYVHMEQQKLKVIDKILYDILLLAEDREVDDSHLIPASAHSGTTADTASDVSSPNYQSPLLADMQQQQPQQPQMYNQQAEYQTQPAQQQSTLPRPTHLAQHHRHQSSLQPIVEYSHTPEHSQHSHSQQQQQEPLRQSSCLSAAEAYALNHQQAAQTPVTELPPPPNHSIVQEQLTYEQQRKQYQQQQQQKQEAAPAERHFYSHRIHPAAVPRSQSITYPHHVAADSSSHKQHADTSAVPVHRSASSISYYTAAHHYDACTARPQTAQQQRSRQNSEERAVQLVAAASQTSPQKQQEEPQRQQAATAVAHSSAVKGSSNSGNGVGLLNASLWFDFTNYILHIRLAAASELQPLTFTGTRFVQIRVLPVPQNGIAKKFKSKAARGDVHADFKNQQFDIDVDPSELSLKHVQISVWSHNTDSNVVIYVGEVSIPLLTMPDDESDITNTIYKLQAKQQPQLTQ